MRQVVIAVATVLTLAGCGSATVVGAGPVSSPYDGPMSLPVDYHDEATVQARSGAAGRALECAGVPYDGGGADYVSGLASVQSSATRALENLLEEEELGTRLPATGYRVERKDDRRILLSYDVDGRTKIAFVVANDLHDLHDVERWPATTRPIRCG